jgi:cell division initiation protein
VPLTPLEIQNREFRRSLRGYNEQDVDEFLDEIVREMEALVREGANLKDQVSRLDARLAQYVDIEDVLKRTLVKAEEAAGDIRTSAQKEADLVVREAKGDANRLIEAARRECTAEREDLARVRREYRNFLARIKGELRVQFEAIEALVNTLSSAPNISAVDAEPLNQPPALDSSPKHVQPETGPGTQTK